MCVRVRVNPGSPERAVLDATIPMGMPGTWPYLGGDPVEDLPWPQTSLGSQRWNEMTFYSAGTISEL